MSKEIRATVNVKGLAEMEKLIEENFKLADALVKNTVAIRAKCLDINLDLEGATIIGK